MKEYKIGELVNLSQGQVINAQTNFLVVEKGLPLLRITDMLNSTQTVFIDSDKVPKKNIAQPEDIIYTRTGQVGLVFTNQYGVVHNNCFKVIPKDEKLDRNFLYWFLKTKSVYDYVNGVASGSAQPDLPHNAFKSITIKLPPIKIQKNIADILFSYDELIKINIQRIEILEETATQLYKEWFVRMRFPDYKQSKFHKGVPISWEIKELDQIADVTSSKRIYLNEYVSSGVPFYRGKEISMKAKGEEIYDPFFISKIKFNEIKARFGVPTVGDILITAVGTIGNVHLVNESDGEFYFKDGNLIWLRDFSDLAMSNYIHSYCISESFSDKLSTITIGSSQEALTIASLKKIKVIIPDEQLLNRFYNQVNPLKKNSEILQQQNVLLGKMRDRLLPKLVSGKLKVKEFSKVYIPMKSLN